MLEARFGGSSFHHRSSSRNFPRASSPRVSSKITNNFGDGPRSPRLSRYTGQRGKLLNLPSPFLLPSFLPFAFLTRNILPPRIFRILCLPRGFHLLEARNHRDSPRVHACDEGAHASPKRNDRVFYSPIFRRNEILSNRENRSSIFLFRPRIFSREKGKEKEEKKKKAKFRLKIERFIKDQIFETFHSNGIKPFSDYEKVSKCKVAFNVRSRMLRRIH